ncbi:tRNA (cytosine(34)-C(5))-methyltransferase, mitochondrial isoform X1 [Caretta caretta]|uniref:tRNA (cytosine(34)-C(5))-methyltransferase, mitochondrial isoform X1 n=2 Tax=Caretta caretta TaxID=8467 RepID=UPI003F4B9864
MRRLLLRAPARLCRQLAASCGPRGAPSLAQERLKSEGKPQKQICQVVLDHFEKQYMKELGEAWSTVREVLTSPLCWQYAVLLNKFSFSSELKNNLRLKGYRSLFQETLPYLPGSLKCYISRTPGRFPAQKHQIGKLKEYYLLNAASLLPVLALEIKDGERILDMCAAPGGKSIAMLQCAWPECTLCIVYCCQACSCNCHLRCNEYDSLRSRWLKQTLESFIPEPLMNLITLSELDGRQMGDLYPELYDKVLLDAPCSNDRSWLFSSDIQQATLRLIQRKELSALQVQLLRSAIKALCPGGSVVYSTCTLSKAENSDVISRHGRNASAFGVKGSSQLTQTLLYGEEERKFWLEAIRHNIPYPHKVMPEDLRCLPEVDRTFAMVSCD